MGEHGKIIFEATRSVGKDSTRGFFGIFVVGTVALMGGWPSRCGLYLRPLRKPLPGCGEATTH